MNDELPQGWAETTVGEIAEDISYGFTAKATTEPVGPRLLRITDIQNGSVQWESVPYCEIPKGKAANYSLRDGDIVFARTGATTGKSFRIRSCPEAVFASYLIRVRPSQSTLPEFLAHFFQSASYWNQISENLSGSAQPNCNASKLATISLPLAPLPEQRRIVAKLTELLGKVGASQQRLAKIPVLLKRFRQSVLAAACSGRLTADWREEEREIESAGDFVRRIQVERKDAYERACATTAKGERKPKLPKNEFTAVVDEDADGLPDRWCVARIGDISDCLDHIRIPINKTERQTRQGTIPYYGANGQVGVIDDFLFDEDLVLVVEDETFIGREIPFSYVIRGKSWVNNHAHVLRPLSGMTVHYLNNSLSYYDFTPLTSGTTGRRKLNQEALINAPLWIAPLPEQQEIVRRVEGLFALADQLEARLAKARGQVDALTPSLLARAFAGQLVPQDPTDEPAEKLLARLRQGPVSNSKTL
jgi:type I restriction enzyme S subunit